MAEWFKAAVLKTADRKVRGFESYSLRHPLTPKEFCTSYTLLKHGPELAVNHK